MPLLGEIVTAVAATVAGEAAASAVSRIRPEVRRRISLGAVVVLWILMLAGMVYGWSLAGRTGFSILAGLLWFVGPFVTPWVTAEWFHRRDA